MSDSKAENRAAHFKGATGGRWPKGISGNPGGRRKNKPLEEELRRFLEEECGGKLEDVIKAVSPKSKRKTTVARAMAAAWIKLFMKGNGPAFNNALDRLDGQLEKTEPDRAEDGKQLDNLIEAIRGTAKQDVAPVEADDDANLLPEAS